MELPDELLRGIYSYGFEKPSAIQQRAIKPTMMGKDLIAQAQSGTVGDENNYRFCTCGMTKHNYALFGQTGSWLEMAEDGNRGFRIKRDEE